MLLNYSKKGYRCSFRYNISKEQTVQNLFFRLLIYFGSIEATGFCGIEEKVFFCFYKSLYFTHSLSFLSLFYESFSLSLYSLTILFPRCFSLLILLCFAVSLPVSFDLLLLYLLLSLLLFCCFILQPRKSLPRCKM
jgi:hypothetical protein